MPGFMPDIHGFLCLRAFMRGLSAVMPGLSVVMPGLVPGIPSFLTWKPELSTVPACGFRVRRCRPVPE